MRVDTIIYHSPCSDGTTAAWAVWRKNPAAKLVPAKYGMKLAEEDYVNKRIAILDFSFSREYLIELARKATFITILDHHKSAKVELESLSLPNLKIIFDMNRSGAQIAWDHMYPECDRHWFVEMVADRDLWVWKLPWSKAVGRATLELGYHESVEKVEELIASNKDYSEFIDIGQYYLDKEAKTIANCVDKAVLAKFVIPGHPQEYKVAVVTGPYFLRSELGNNAVKKHNVDFAVMFQYAFPQDEWNLSFRTLNEKNIDLSVIASLLPNGGGHPSASGATIYGPNSNPPEKFSNRKGETMFTYLKLNCL